MKPGRCANIPGHEQTKKESTVDNYKTCTGCKQEKPNSEFSPSKLGKLGTRSRCKQCCVKQSKNYRAANHQKVLDSLAAYRRNNPEKVKSLNQKFRKENPNYAKDYYKNYRESELLRSKMRYWKDTSKEAARKKKARQSSPEVFRERNKKYAQSNPEMIRAKAQRRRANIAKNKTFSISKKELLFMYSANCFYCSNKAQTLDHVVPISRGGSHGVGNLVPACNHCNFSKAGRTIMEWRIWKLRLSL